MLPDLVLVRLFFLLFLLRPLLFPFLPPTEGLLPLKLLIEAVHSGAWVIVCTVVVLWVVVLNVVVLVVVLLVVACVVDLVVVVVVVVVVDVVFGWTAT